MAAAEEGAASANTLGSLPGPPSTLIHSRTPSLSSTPQPQIQPDAVIVHSDRQTAKSKHDVDAADMKMTNQLSQTVAATTSGSSLSSVKDEDLSSSAPYGTRSRNRSGARPNYADDVDMENDFLIYKADTASSKRSTPTTETMSSFRAINGTAFTQSIPKTSSQPDDPNPLAEPSKASPISSTNGHVEKKKRKYERVNGVKAAIDGRQPPKDAIPGMSQFSSLPNGTPDPPPSKKRRVTDGNASSLPASAIPSAVTVSRKSSAAHVTRPGRETCLVTFEKSRGLLQNNILEADDGSTFAVNDHVYLICEPPGEPYYLCRIMEFRRANMDDENSPITSMLVNWFYRPKDIQRINNDTRYLYASMQSDEAPITSLRGKCIIKHRSELMDLEEFRKQRDTFWFNQLYDRYIQRAYEMLPSNAVINVPENVKKVLDERWKFLVVEPARMKELTSAIKLCKRCNGYCAPNDSVDCGVCRNTYHMTCVRPPLAKKPSRGFAWSCGPCSRAQEKRLEQRHTAIIPEAGTEREEDPLEEEEDEAGTLVARPQVEHDLSENAAVDIAPSVQMDIARAKMWPWRYLGIHCRVEDVLQYDDRAIYPRASSRLGPRHQAVNSTWFGRPVELVKPLEIKRKYIKGAGNKKDAKLSKETIAAIEADKSERVKRPKWIQDEPPGYVARGGDVGDLATGATAEALFIMPPPLRSSFTAANASTDPNEKIVDDYMAEARAHARRVGLARTEFPGYRSNKDTSRSAAAKIIPTNFLDKALQILTKHNFNTETALLELRAVQMPKDIGDPDLTKEEMKRFEDGVARYGSELRSVRRHVKTRPHREIVRLYYSWKKSERGQEIWSHHGERRHTRKKTEVSWTEIADEEDDSAFDNAKSAARKRSFQCKFCLTRSSRQWRRAPMVAPGAVVLIDPKGSAKDRANQLVVALCQRCAILWRRYAMRWEDIDEIAKSFLQSGGRATRRKAEEEILRELVYANEAAGVPTSAVAASAALSIGIRVAVPQPQDPAKKKVKTGLDKESTPALTDTESQPKKKEKEKIQPEPPPPRPPTPPIEPQQPKWRQLPCAVCREINGDDKELIPCNHCKMTVHRRCYAISEQMNAAKWICDTCRNDKQNEVSMDYKCVLCPVNDRKPDLLEPPKVTHKKKTDRDREKERLEKILAVDMAQRYHKAQIDKGRPPWPREAVKKTASNNWMHIVCAVWTPEIRFSDAENMDTAEGMASAITAPGRVDTVCKLCRVIDGGCVSCQDCNATFHVACAHEAGYIFGFDITPVKATRKDTVQIVKLGQETGHMTAVIWCSEHTVEKGIRHKIDEIVPETGLNALQTFVRTYKQADRTLTGTVRKAINYILPPKSSASAAAVAPPSSGRASLITNGNSATKTSKSSPHMTEEPNTDGTYHDADHDKHQCITCQTDSSVQWRRFEEISNDDRNSFRSGHGYLNGVTAASSSWQCHKCHVREKLDIKAVPQITESKDDAREEPRQPDYFELTAPRPVPPVLLPTWSPNGSVHTTGQATSEEHEVTEKAQQELRASNFTVTNQVGVSHRMSGSIFGRLDDAPLIGWNFFLTHVQDNLGYDALRHAVQTEDAMMVYNSSTLMAALAEVLRNQQRDVRWRIVDYTPERPYVAPQPPQHTSVLYPPPMTSLRAPLQAPRPPIAYSGTIARPTSSSGIRPYSTMQPMPQQQHVQGLPDISLSTGMRPSPYFSQSPSTQHSGMAPAFTTGGTSPTKTMMQPRRSTTPREQQHQQPIPSVSGASSSPSLKNLVH